ncbi:MAG: Na+-transporting NADH:ubiquinone oxidoreductase subunit G, partial [Prevotella sp.]|nr:Na+-transporting NADH:ubiquinone oxidoreductase subunit G [Prevotella sp.]
MEKLKSSLTNMVVVLVVVAVVTSGLLAVVNHVTEGPKAVKAEKTLADGIKKVMCTQDLTVTSDETITTQDEKGKDVAYVVYKVTDKAGKELGAAVKSTTLGFGGDLEVLVGFDPEG